MPEPKNNPRQWHQRARQMRLMAQNTADPDVQAQLMQIAQSYDAMARKAERDPNAI
jgi:hypothetical protein